MAYEFEANCSVTAAFGQHFRYPLPFVPTDISSVSFAEYPATMWIATTMARDPYADELNVNAKPLAG